MKFRRLAIVVLFSLSTVAFGQTESPNWQHYESPNGMYSFELPNPLADNLTYPNDSVRKDKSKLTNATFGTNWKGVYYRVFIEKNTRPGEKFVSKNQVIDRFIIENGQSSVETELGDCVGKLYSFLGNDGFQHKIVIAESSGFSFIFHAISTYGSNSDVDRFIKSVKIKLIIDSNIDLPKATELAKSENISHPVIEDKHLAPSPSSRLESSGGRGGGMSGGIGPGKSSENDKPVETKKPTSQVNFSALRIISQPKAAYTNLARIYSISGVVRLKVLFLSDGKIGSVTAVSQLPFGLTKSAIDAARTISFDPLTRDGAPINVVKILEYRFTIY